MRKSWLVCVLLGTLAWGQALPATTPSSPAQSPAAASNATPPPEVPENAVVLTIKGVCPAVPRTTAASKTSTGKPASAPARKPADCKTEITRAQFEKIAAAVSPTPTITPQLKRQLESALPGEGEAGQNADSGGRTAAHGTGGSRQSAGCGCGRVLQEESRSLPAVFSRPAVHTALQAGRA